MSTPSVVRTAVLQTELDRIKADLAEARRLLECYLQRRDTLNLNYLDSDARAFLTSGGA